MKQKQKKVPTDSVSDSDHIKLSNPPKKTVPTDSDDIKLSKKQFQRASG